MTLPSNTRDAEPTGSSGQAASSFKKPPAVNTVLDNWEDDSASDTEKEVLSPSTATTANPRAPPPTPSSPFVTSGNSQYGYAAFEMPGEKGASSGGRANPDVRPDTTTAVAGRLIAGALGVRAPRRTEEEREYDKAMREKERKRRENERSAAKQVAEDAEKAKRSVWED